MVSFEKYHLRHTHEHAPFWIFRSMCYLHSRKTNGFIVTGSLEFEFKVALFHLQDTVY